jgi:nucleoside-diphosphate-sugar epimerase
MAKRIALTGATGFAGGPILAALLAAGHDVKALVRRPRERQFSPVVNVVTGGLDDTAALGALVVDADVVVHVAGAISAISEAEYFRANFAGTKQLFETAQAAGVKRFVYVSSLAARLPSISAYAASKRAAEDYLQTVSTKMDVVILRPSAIYGPGDKATLPLLAALQKRVALLPGKASARFSLVHIADFAAVVAEAVLSDSKGLFEIDDMAGGHGWAELAEINLKQAGVPQHITYLPKGLVSLVALGAEVATFFTGLPGMVNRAKVRELYHEDWVVRGTPWPRANPIGLEKGLIETLNWYRSEGWLPPLKQADRRPA